MYSSSILIGSIAGTAGSTNGVGTSVSLTNPAYMALGTGSLAGVLLVGEQTGCRIRAVNLSNAGVATVAGGATCATVASTGDVNGPLPNILMNLGGIAWAQQTEVLYFSSLTGYRVRVAVPGANVTTVAGSGVSGSLDGIGTNAQFGGPRGLALDEVARVLYLVDYVKHVVRTINLTSRAVTTLAGTGAQGYADGAPTAAIFFQPTGGLLSTDRTALFVTDSGSNRIRKITLSAPGNASFVSLVLQGTPQSPRDLLLDTSGGQQALLIVNFAAGVLQRLDISASSSGNAAVVAGAGGSTVTTANALALQSNFSGFMGGAMTSNGVNIFLSEYNGNRVRVLTLVCPMASPSATPPATSSATLSASQPATPSSTSSLGASSSTTPTPSATSVSATSSSAATTSSTPSLTALPTDASTDTVTQSPVPASPSATGSISQTATAQVPSPSQAAASLAGSTTASASPSNGTSSDGVASSSGGSAVGSAGPIAAGVSCAVVLVLVALAAVFFLRRKSAQSQRVFGRGVGAQGSSVSGGSVNGNVGGGIATSSSAATNQNPLLVAGLSSRSAAIQGSLARSAPASSAPQSAPDAASSADLPPGWTQAWSTSKQLPYWRHVDGRASWVHPGGSASQTT